MASDDSSKLCSDFGQFLQEDLGALLGVSLQLQGPTREDLRRGQQACGDAPVVCAPCRAEGADSGPVLCAPAADAVALGGVLRGLDAEALAAKREVPPDPDLLEGIGEVLETASASLSRALDAAGLAGVQRGEVRFVERPDADDDWVPGGALRRLRWTLSIPDQPDAVFDLLLPAAVLDAWSGERPESAGAEGAGEPTSLESRPAPQREIPEDAALIAVAADEETRASWEALEAELGHAVASLDPGALLASGLGELEEAGAVVVDWDLQVCAGVDLVGLLRLRPETRHLPLALASERPTREMVRAALQCGADTFLMKPYDPEEVRARFGLAASPADPSAAEDGEDGAGAEAAEG